MKCNFNLFLYNIGCFIYKLINIKVVEYGCSKNHVYIWLTTLYKQIDWLFRSMDEKSRWKVGFLVYLIRVMKIIGIFVFKVRQYRVNIEKSSCKLLLNMDRRNIGSNSTRWPKARRIITTVLIWLRFYVMRKISIYLSCILCLF